MGGSFALLGRFVYTRSRDLLKDGLRISLARPKAALIWVAGMALLPLLYGPVPHLFWYLFPLWLLIGGGLTITAAALRAAGPPLPNWNNSIERWRILIYAANPRPSISHPSPPGGAFAGPEAAGELCRGCRS